MDLFTVDQEKCTRCGACVAVCPARIIEQLNALSVPTPLAGGAERCIDCGHCVAVCPSAALTHRSMAPEQCPPVRGEFFLPPDRAEHFLRFRRSIRSYQTRPVERQVLTKLIDLASYAPSGHNSQSLQWRVIYDPQAVQNLAAEVVAWMRHMIEESPAIASGMNLQKVVEAWESGIDRVCRSAPHIILAHALQADRFAPLSAPIALTYLELSAPSFGLGTCWGGYFTVAAKNWPPLQKALSLPEGHVTYGVLMVGYPQYKYHRLPLRKPPVVTWG